MSIPDFTAEAAKLAQSARSYSYDSPVLTGSAAVALARRMFALGMRYGNQKDECEGTGACEEEATLIENGGNP